jgi:hypothetical protein
MFTFERCQSHRVLAPCVHQRSKAVHFDTLGDGVHPMCSARVQPLCLQVLAKGVLLTNVTLVRTVRLPKSSFTQTIVSFLDKDANSPWASLHRFTEARIREPWFRYILNTHDVFNTLSGKFTSICQSDVLGIRTNQPVNHAMNSLQNQRRHFHRNVADAGIPNTYMREAFLVAFQRRTCSREFGEYVDEICFRP